MEPILTPGEWEALLHQVPSQVRAFAVRLAIAHKHLKLEPDGKCPACNQGTDAKERQ